MWYVYNTSSRECLVFFMSRLAPMHNVSNRPTISIPEHMYVRLDNAPAYVASRTQFWRAVYDQAEAV